jgi:hypothetical protein
MSDESSLDLEKRKYYIQKYEFTMMGFLIDEDEFEVKPAVSRVLQLNEVTDSKKRQKKNKMDTNPSSYSVDVNFSESSNISNKRFFDKVDLNFIESVNSKSYDVYINDNFYGTNLSKIQVNSEDLLRFEIIKLVDSDESKLKFIANIV